ncbi:MAG: hypothetical protein WCX31_05515 [Salinivirgaceae bacterium]|jgi:hypothetical protein
MSNDNFWCPKIFKLKTKYNQEVEINSTFIFYIHVSKEKKIIYLTEPAKIGDKSIWEIPWKTRKYGIKKLLDFLGGKGFIQINKTTIIRNVHISGRDADWKYVYITMPSKRTIGGGVDSWKNVALPLGRSYAFQVRKHVFDTRFIVKNKDGDIFFVSPLDIVIIEYTKGVKIMHLEKPVCRNDKSDFTLQWHDRKSFNELMTEDARSWFVQVHRKFFVRVDYPFKILYEKGNTFLCLERNEGSLNTSIYNRKIPVGNIHKNHCIEIFDR